VQKSHKKARVMIHKYLTISYYAIIKVKLKRMIIMKIFNIKTLLFSLVLVLVMGTTLFTGCVTFTRPDTTTTTSPISTSTLTTTGTPIATEWTPPGTTTAGTGSQLPDIADVVELVKPAVVSINTEVTVDNPFFGESTQQGAGSGWIIDSNGIIVTNNHVVEGAKTITVTLDNGKTYTADTKNVYTDVLNDLAIIKIDATGLPSLKTGDASKMRLGDWVIAIGNALGQGTRVTQGIISRKDVSLSVDTSDTLYNLIETTAAINPGNSGGPLVNLAGQVIGITSAKIASVGVEGMGYAISINTALPVIEELVTKGYVTRPYLGVRLYTVDELAINEFNLKVDKGVLIVETTSGSPAASAGLKSGDVIVGIGGKDVTTVEELTTVLRASTIGQPLEIKYWRGSTESTVMVTPVAAPR
jgi:serine protease Do